MKKFLSIAVVIIMAMTTATAQKIRTIDKSGQPVPYVSVMTTDAKYIGITDIDPVRYELIFESFGRRERSRDHFLEPRGI